MSVADSVAVVEMVVAEDAPLGVLLYPVREGYEDARTLDAVEVYTYRAANAAQAYVRWTYRDGGTRTFAVGELVAVEIQS